MLPLPVRWDWMMLVSDMTVVIDRNLKNLLMRYNHTQPYAIGSRLRLTGKEPKDTPLYYSGLALPAVVMPPLITALNVAWMRPEEPVAMLVLPFSCRGSRLCAEPRSRIDPPGELVPRAS